ncbi:MAG: PAAT family amino acid ABC transporter substrate-binding protein [Pseudomonas sp.]|uniref:PAAT family amino acid ABC transporter substrate-binding protein n=1 Tax=Pseudomonas sp. TaxID=306 RepID=UPI0033993926
MPKGLVLSLVCLLPLAFTALPCAAAQEVTAWTYHQMPPLLVDLDNRQGLSFDLLELLNDHPDNRQRYHFSLLYLPRKRLDMTLVGPSSGLVLWASPDFFPDTPAPLYHWLPSLLTDQQDFLSRVDRPFDYQGPDSLRGHTLGGVLGHRYQGLQTVIENGAVQREDVALDQQNLEKLLSRRLDLILIPHSTVLFYNRQQDLSGRLYFSPAPLNRFNRQMLLKYPADPELGDFLEKAIRALPQDPKWLALLKHYGLD